jgi:hypothetical protein
MVAVRRHELNEVVSQFGQWQTLAALPQKGTILARKEYTGGRET